MTEFDSGTRTDSESVKLPPVLLDDLSDLILELDQEDRIIFANQAARRFWPEIAIKHQQPLRFADLVCSETQSGTERKTAVCRRSGRRLEYLKRRRAGENALIIARPLCDLSS